MELWRLNRYGRLHTPENIIKRSIGAGLCCGSQPIGSNQNRTLGMCTRTTANADVIRAQCSTRCSKRIRYTIAVHHRLIDAPFDAGMRGLHCPGTLLAKHNSRLLYIAEIDQVNTEQGNHNQ